MRNERNLTKEHHEFLWGIGVKPEHAPNPRRKKIDDDVPAGVAAGTSLETPS
jgi:hypothetical protein